MVKFFRIKEKARGLARQHKYDQALAEYRTAITEAEAERDLPALRHLYNAAGDASLQKNDAASAVEFFEKAADSYLEEGLHDNAIALCHKILRHVPTKVDAYARLGRIYGEKGLRNEALQNWLEYAERREKASDVAGVTRALREVIALSPESAGARQQLAEILLAQGQAEAALAELEELRRRAAAAGESDRAAELAGRIAVLRGEEPVEPPRELAAGAPEDGRGGAPKDVSAEPVAGEPLPLLSRDSGPGFSPGDAALTPPGAPAAPGRGAAEAIPEEPLGARAGEAGPEEAPPIWSLPGFSPAQPAGAAQGSAGLRSAAGEASLSPPDEALPPAPPRVPVEERIARAEARLAENPGDAEERIYLAELYQEAGDLERARVAMERGASELFEASQHEKAYRAYRRLAGLSPDDLEVVHRLVETAQATGSREYLLQAYELLGDRLMEAGRYPQAAEVHSQILAIDPGHRHSQDQLLILEGLDARPAAGAPGEPAAAALPQPSPDYMDLSRLVGEGETRREAEPAPSGEPQPAADEPPDLQATLDALRRGVTDEVQGREFESHYDLGVAFREMGLLDEAIRAFQLAARGSERRERAFELMGLCFMEKGMLSVAANCFRRGIESGRDAHGVVALHYHLGRSLEELGDADAARREYEHVVALDLSFMDAAERLRKLG